LKINKYRKIHRKFIAEGPKIAGELLSNSSGLLVTDKVLSVKKWIEEYKNSIPDNVELIEITEKELKKISSLKSPNQVIVIVNIPDRETIPRNIYSDLTLVLDEIKDPGNMGTIIRTADWFGISDIICSNECVDVYNPKVVQATMGSLVRVSIFYKNLEDYLRKIPAETKVYGTVMDGKNIYETKLENRGLILIGNESKGVSTKLKPFITDNISIPSFPVLEERSTESLNASIATAIVCAEFRRTKQEK
jgi:TrmH family RNA methyltransferase